MEPSHESFHVVKRAESIVDLVVQLREPLISVFMDIWTQVYKDDKITKTKWLQQFQLQLKTVKDISDEDIADRVSHKKRILTNLYDALMSTAYIHHNNTVPCINKEKPLLYHFVRDCMLHIGRELWTKPYLVYNITHRKSEVANARDALEKVVASAIKYQVRSMTDDIMIIEAQRKEKCKDIVSSPAPSIASLDEDTCSLAASPVAPLTEAALQAQQHNIMYNNQPMALVPLALARVPSAPASLGSIGLQAHSPSPSSSPRHSHNPSSISSPAQSIKSIKIGRRNRDRIEDEDDIRSILSEPKSPSINHMDYIPLKRPQNAEYDGMSVSDRGHLGRPSQESTKSIKVRAHNHSYEHDTDSPSILSSSASSSSSSSKSRVVVEKNDKLSRDIKPKTSLQKYGYYRQHSAVAALMNKNKDKHQTPKRRHHAFFK